MERCEPESCVGVWVCGCERQRRRGRGKDRECVCVCVCERDSGRKREMKKELASASEMQRDLVQERDVAILCRFQANREQPLTFEGFVRKSQSQNAAWTLWYVPCSLDSGITR